MKHAGVDERDNDQDELRNKDRVADHRRCLRNEEQYSGGNNNQQTSA